MIVALLAACSQGESTGTEQITDTSVQAPIDALLIVSEAPESEAARIALGTGIAAFQEALDATGTDWQLGVISARLAYGDPDSGALLGDPSILRPGDELAAVLPSRLPAGETDGEQGVSATLFAFHPTMTLEGGTNHGVLRAEADLLLIFVSVQDDDSPVVLEDFVSDLVERKGDREVLAAGFVPTDTTYEDAVELLDGSVYDPNATDWSEALGAIGTSVAGP